MSVRWISFLSDWRLLAWLVLSCVALVYTVDDGTDAFQHFLQSVTYLTTLNFRAIALSVWDKPLPILVYGVSGLVGGIYGARLASVSLCVATAFMMVSLVRGRVEGARDAPGSSAVLFLLVMPVFLQSFLTMTELIAGFLLAWSLYLYYVKERPLAACLVAGFLPMARVESGLFLATLLIFFVVLQTLERQPHWVRRVVCMVVLASLPCLLWFSACWAYSEDFFYIAHNGYAFSRPFDAEQYAVHNGITALPSVLTPPALFLTLLGVFSVSRRGLFSRRRDGAFLLLCLLIILVFLAFTVSVIAYPRGELHWELLIPVINGRAYNVVAPVLAVFACLGVVRLRQLGADVGQVWIKGLVERYLLAIWFVGLALVYLCKKQFSINNSPFSQSVGAYLWLYLATLIFAMSAVHFESVRRHVWRGVTGLIVLSFLAIVPRFYEPTRFSDQNFKLQTELTDFVSLHYGGGRTLLLQNFSPSIEYFVGKPLVQAKWQWPTHFVEESRKFDGKVLVMIRTEGEARAPLPVYNAALLKFVKTLREVRRSVAVSPQGWVLYEAK